MILNFKALFSATLPVVTICLPHTTWSLYLLVLDRDRHCGTVQWLIPFVNFMQFIAWDGKKLCVVSHNTADVMFTELGVIAVPHSFRRAVVCPFSTGLLKDIDVLAEDYLNNVRTMAGEARKEHLAKIQNLFTKSKEFGDDKVQLAIQTYEMVGTLYMRK